MSKGPSEVSASVKAYFALKLARHSRRRCRACARLRERILALGGIQAANSYVKVNLSLFDLYPREHCPAFRRKSCCCRASCSTRCRRGRAPSSSRSPSCMRTIRAARFPPDSIWTRSVARREHRAFRTTTWLSWRNVVPHDRRSPEAVGAQRLAPHPRSAHSQVRALDARADEITPTALGAIYPPMMYSIMALDVLGYAEGSSAARGSGAPVRQPDGRRWREVLLPALLFARLGYRRSRPIALGEAGSASTRACAQRPTGCSTREIRRKGDWSVKRPNTEPSGWAFEFHNDLYPDIDDTAMVLLALPHMRAARMPRRSRHASKRALDWLLAMQSKDGGWAAFDVDNNWEFLSHVPFADHNAMLDPTCADITGPRARSAGARTGRPRVIRRAARRRLSGPHPAARWKLVRPLGRRLYLRHLLRAARPARGGRERPRSPRPARRRMAALHPERRWRLGRKLRQLRQRHLSRRRRARHRRPPGRCWA